MGKIILIITALLVVSAVSATAQTSVDPDIAAHCKKVAKSLGTHSYVAELGCIQMETKAKRELEFREIMRRGPIPIVKAPSNEQEVREECAHNPDPDGCFEWEMRFLKGADK